MSDELWPIIGVDESGKGDFFGPLVIAGVLIEEWDVLALEDIGVRDSKKITDKKILSLAAVIREKYVCNTVVIMPEKYNQLYLKIRNLNKLLGWGHAKVIENILTEKPAPAAISDKFGKDHFITDNLQEKGKQIDLIQKVRGEAHPAVAAASVLARAEFINRMDGLSRQYGISFHKGASAAVDAVGRDFVRINGEGMLNKVAKLHFKNYQKIMA
ncbi:MAG: ribonuclease HIII [Candidatus Zixiibacteriota bacterium]